jgi:TolB-like protein
MAESSRAVFLSYASEDAGAAWRICEALRTAGIEVWFDRSDLRGGDAWDRKIRGQIKDCALFIPILSANSQARLEGYFRREWRLAVERTHDMADDRHFLLPVVIDETKQADAHVPESFRAVQWTRLHAGPIDPGFAERVSGLLPHSSRTPTLPGYSPAATTTNALAAAPVLSDGPIYPQLRHAKPRPRALALWLTGVAVVGILAVGGYFLVIHTAPVVPAARNESSPSAPSDTAGRLRIAVLPFENLSPDPNNAFFTDGMHEEILTALANDVPGLDVISRTTMDTYKGKSVTAQTLSRELHCNYVLEGSMRRDGSEVRLALQLIDARTDSHVWAKDFDRKLVKVMALESEVASAVASQLSIKLAAAMTAQMPATDPEVFDLYLKARAIVATATVESPIETWQGAVDLLDQAVRIDPTFVRAYVERISIRLSIFMSDYDASEKYLVASQQDLEIVKKLSPQDPAAISAEALLAYVQMDYGRSLQLFEAAEQAGLEDPYLLDWKGQLLFEMGRYQDATELSRRLVDLDPKNGAALFRWWFQLMETHQPQEAIRVAGLASTSDLRAGLRLATLWEYGADTNALAAGVARAAPRSPATAVNDADIGDAVANLEFLHRYAEARRLIDQLPGETWHQWGWDWPLARVGRTPLADLRGWVDLLLADAPAARRDGQRILAFLKAEPETRWNKWFRTMLRAEALLYMGDHAGAIATADSAVALTRAGPDVSDQTNAFVWATQIRGWAGAQEEAAARLETLTTSVPGLWPGEITRNPVWIVPLAQNARFQALRDRLVAQQKALRLE